MRALSILFAGLSIGMLAGACARSSSAEQELEARLTALRSAGRLPAPGAVVNEPVPADVRGFFERFEAAQARLAQGPPERDDRRALAAFQAEAAALADMPVCRTALRERESLAQPLRRFPPSPEAERVDTPGLPAIREWTELLCARARLEAAEPAGGPAASASLVTALELLSVWNDHSLIGEVVCGSQERVVLDTLRALAPLESVDARALRGALDPYLQTRSHAELVETVTIETGFWMRAVDGLLASGEGVSTADMEQLGFTGASFAAATHAILDRHEAILELRDDPCLSRLSDEENVDGPRLGYALQEWHARNIRLALARVALAVVAWREESGVWPQELDQVAGLFAGGVPEHPCARLRFDYARTEDGFRLSSSERGEGGHGLGHEARAAWSWPPGIVGQ